ncbi:GGDEF domain-containing protein [Desulfovibrio sp. JC022]|uniref:GGDEF domain-containing protein n=1 Tax=Desulfovibrio sp. JC022 TaxID=2593642 RepID=UPI0013D17657|nr:GGDEF domain-containing protein [Desulfovibrio sp. JC022]NDV21870.1 GGDEF domain-containing protein [Desulfovibrio sp. JC022]
MRFQDAARLRYRITLPIILLLALSALHIFHTLLIERSNLTDTQELLNGLQATAGEILTSPEGMGYDSAAKAFTAITDKLQNYPEDNRFKELLNDENSGLFLSTDNFLAAVKSGDNSTIKKAMRKLGLSIGMVSSDINKSSTSDHVDLVKYEYGILFLICILAVIQYYLVDSPMRDELIRCAREKELSKSTIKKLAERDTLTNLPGRMKFYEESEKAVSTATRYGSDLALIKMDIHDFKTINQQHGQKAGDKILAGFARVVRKNLRRPDSFFRVGGDKFIILAPHTSVTNAKNLMEKINKLITRTKSLKAVPFLLNTGIAMSEHKESAESLLKKVDLALNESKKYGPGAVYTHPESAKPAE